MILNAHFIVFPGMKNVVANKKTCNAFNAFSGSLDFYIECFIFCCVAMRQCDVLCFMMSCCF